VINERLALLSGCLFSVSKIVTRRIGLPPLCCHMVSAMTRASSIGTGGKNDLRDMVWCSYVVLMSMSEAIRLTIPVVDLEFSVREKQSDKTA
jgi:hypothetical protein